jgi:glycosyltransferase involved in cell wall biosynthesis
MRILFLIRELRADGAERQLSVLAAGLRRAGHAPGVAVFYGGGALEQDLAAAGVPVFHLGKRGRWDLGFLGELVRVARAFQPDVVHAYMATSNKCVAVLKPVLKPARIVWGVRSAYMDLSHYDWPTRVASWLEQLLAGFADAIIANSEAGRAYAASVGFPADRLAVVPNGIDCERFSRDLAGRARWRERWGVKDSDLLIGLVGRLDPMKDPPTFLRAGAQLAARRPNVTFACVGGGPASYRAGLEQLAGELKLSDRVRWERPTQDLRAVYSALDVLALSSYGESFPNVVAEAMACGTPCVATEVGDVRSIVGDTGVIVPPSDPDGLANGLDRLLAEGPGALAERGAAARRRIAADYSIEALVTKTLAVLDGVRARAGGR